MKKKKYYSLSAVVGAVTTLVVAGSMLVYASIQYWVFVDVLLWRLLLEHTWHAVILGGITYMVLQALLQSKVVKPVQQLYTALYRISKGDESKVVVDTRIKEIQDIADSINLMLVQLQLSSTEPWVEKLRVRGAGLRAMAAKVNQTMDTSDVHIMTQTAEDLDELALMIERFEARTQNMSHSPSI